MAALFGSAVADCPPISSHSQVTVSAHTKYHHVHELQCEGGPPTQKATLYYKRVAFGS